MNVLSLFDGISCGRVVLQRAGIKIDNYFASEIDKYAIKVTQHNSPDTHQLGDITKIDGSQFTDELNIDLLIGGSPCQGFSFAGKQLNQIKKINPNVKFLLENVKMKKEYQYIISEHLGVQPVEINSALVSAQNRKRLYWTNIGKIEQPEDKGIFLKDIIESGVVDRDKSYCIDANYWKGGNLKQYFEKGRRQLVFEAKNKKQVFINLEDINIVPRTFYETRTDLGKRARRDARINKLRDTTPRSKDHKKYVISPHQKANCLVTVDSFLNYIIDENYYVRKLSPIECERLQGLPDDYTSVISNSQRYKALGNGWQVDTIVHIFNYLK